MGHYIVIGIVVALIIGAQIFFFCKTLKEIKKFSKIFPNSTDHLYAKDSEIFIKNESNKQDEDEDDVFLRLGKEITELAIKMLEDNFSAHFPYVDENY